MSEETSKESIPLGEQLQRTFEGVVDDLILLETPSEKNITENLEKRYQNDQFYVRMLQRILIFRHILEIKLSVSTLIPPKE